MCKLKEKKTKEMNAKKDNVKNCEDRKKIKKENISQFKQGVIDSFPIALGYFAVSFALGIAAKNAGLTPIQAFITSVTNNASAGQYVGFSVIAAGGSLIEMAIIILVTNARYLLMSCAFSQKFDANTAWYHKILVGFYLTDELFALAISREGKLNPYYYYAGMMQCLPCWALGTLLGVVAGQLLPENIVKALGISLFGMFIAIIIPPSKNNKVLVLAVSVSFALSYIFTITPVLSAFSEGNKIIVLTIVISTLLAIFFPLNNNAEKVKNGN